MFMLRLNRTSVGLKRCSNQKYPHAKKVPQSNQRGIETSTGRRTPGPLWGPPQSNQRGIETISFHPALWAILMPQSNQRGIETQSLELGGGDQRRGLNRTSVGLKRIPGSNKILTRMSLNRTSVGLKP